MQSAKKWTGKEIYFEFVWHSICPFCFAKKKGGKKTGWAGCRSRKVIHGKPSQGKLGRGTARENYGRGANQQENFEISAISSEVCLGRPALCQEGKSLELSGQRNLFALLELPALSKKPQKLQ